MEHRHTEPADKTQAVGAPHRASSLLDKHNDVIDKLTRKQVSHCIHIWAAVYHLHDADTNTPRYFPPDSWSVPQSSHNNRGN